MSEQLTKKINARIVQKHAYPEDWSKAENFVPKQGEIIVYDDKKLEPYIDDSGKEKFRPVEGTETGKPIRFKIGDGVSTVNELPFASPGGIGTNVTDLTQTAIGKYNVEESTALFIVGNGSSDTNRSNCFSAGADSNGAYAKIGDKKVATIEDIPDLHGVEFTNNSIELNNYSDYSINSPTNITINSGDGAGTLTLNAGTAIQIGNNDTPLVYIDAVDTYVGGKLYYNDNEVATKNDIPSVPDLHGVEFTDTTMELPFITHEGAMGMQTDPYEINAKSGLNINAVYTNGILDDDTGWKDRNIISYLDYDPMTPGEENTDILTIGTEPATQADTESTAIREVHIKGKNIILTPEFQPTEYGWFNDPTPAMEITGADKPIVNIYGKLYYNGDEVAIRDDVPDLHGVTFDKDTMELPDCTEDGIPYPYNIKTNSGISITTQIKDNDALTPTRPVNILSCTDVDMISDTGYQSVVTLGGINNSQDTMDTRIKGTTVSINIEGSSDEDGNVLSQEVMSFNSYPDSDGSFRTDAHITVRDGFWYNGNEVATKEDIHTKFGPLSTGTTTDGENYIQVGSTTLTETQLVKILKFIESIEEVTK